MKLLIFDNYDSFTYNIVHAVRSLGFTPEVHRNDAIALDDIARFDKIIISPGPGIPSESGLLMPMLARYAAEKPMLGICLGHQALAEHFGGKIYNLNEPIHGIGSKVTVTADDYLFEGLPKTFTAGRYHSWAVDEKSLPDSLEVTARSADGCVMAMRHRSLDIHGVQFHPESILTPEGINIINNFLQK